MTVPDALNLAVRCWPSGAENSSVVVLILASAICEATVRFQIMSYSTQSSPTSSPVSCPGVRNTSPAGRIASWASWALALLPL